MLAVDKLRSGLEPGRVYRRRDLTKLSSSVDRHLKSLVEDGSLKKLQHGLYACPASSLFGDAPPGEDELLEAFLRSKKFLAYSPGSFNALGLGTTQLYSVRTVLNQKRHGSFVLDGRNYFFQRRLNIPSALTKEVLLVEFLNNLKKLGEDPNELLQRVSSHLPSFDAKKLVKAATLYGTYSTQLRVDALLKPAGT